MRHKYPGPQTHSLDPISGSRPPSRMEVHFLGSLSSPLDSQCLGIPPLLINNSLPSGSCTTTPDKDHGFHKVSHQHHPLFELNSSKEPVLLLLLILLLKVFFFVLVVSLSFRGELLDCVTHCILSASPSLVLWHLCGIIDCVRPMRTCRWPIPGV